MPHARDVLYMVGAAVLGVLVLYVVGLRRRSYGKHLVDVAEAEICEHLRPRWNCSARAATASPASARRPPRCRWKSTWPRRSTPKRFTMS